MLQANLVLAQSTRECHAHHMLQLPYVPRPIGEFEGRERLECELGWNDLPGWPDALMKEAICQEGNIFRALGKSRQMKHVVAEAVTEVGDQRATCNQVVEVAVHADHEPGLNGDAAIGAKGPVLMSVEHTEQEELLVASEMLEVVEQNRATAGFSEEAATPRDGAAECTTLVPE